MIHYGITVNNNQIHSNHLSLTNNSLKKLNFQWIEMEVGQGWFHVVPVRVPTR